MHPRAFRVLALAAVTAAGSGARTPRPTSSTKAPDWVVDRCKVTYKGVPVPLGMGLPEFTRLFGPPSDSLITPWPGKPGHAPVKTYFWDNMGMRTRFFSDAHPDLFGGVELSFREPFWNPRMHKRRFVRGTSTVEFRPFGLLDSNSMRTVMAEGFKPGHAPDAKESEYLDLRLNKESMLSLLPLKDDRIKDYGLSLRYGTPDDSRFRNYAQAQRAMDASCRLPDR